MGGASSRKKAESCGEVLSVHPDEKCSNQEKEKNHWACMGKDGESMNIYGKHGQECVVKFEDLENIQTGFPVFRRL
ncbi:hypothetical protein CAEBREN_03365 [Caenorhabditis brenneri]|uniref:Uncharacterized protein n=1 Tax=Caenorhabditis brenneri TaxID=135651 RepID=G0PD29_CAEBE|nr:hypothetical protein CAEBREN_03365 [Caenorhabditis brenneri]